MYIHITYVAFRSSFSWEGTIDGTDGRPSQRGPDEGQIARAKVLAEDLLLVVRQEHAKAATAAQQQQMELHHAQQQYAAYSMGVRSRFLSLSLCYWKALTGTTGLRSSSAFRSSSSSSK